VVGADVQARRGPAPLLPRPARAEEPGRITIVGTLAIPAWVATANDNSVWLCVDLSLKGTCMVQASQRIGTGYAAQMVASRACQYLRAGARATVRAQRFEWRDKPRAHLHLLDVTGIEYPVPPARHEPQESEAA
jgi:hypothetical protein